MMENKEMLVFVNSATVALTPTFLILNASSHPPHIAYFSLIKKKHHFKLRAKRVSIATTSQRCYFSAVCNFEIRCNHARLDVTK